MPRKKIKEVTDQRKFTIIYNDFLESNLLDKHEKLIFITIKRFADNDTLVAFPSLRTLHRLTGISIEWIKKSIAHMEELGIIRVTHRENEKQGKQSNLYTLYDYAEIWKSDNAVEAAEIIDDLEEQHMIQVLQKKGYSISKEKEPGTAEPTKVIAEPDTQNIKQYNTLSNDTTNLDESQPSERYSLDEIKQLFDYEIMIHDNPLMKNDIDSVMEMLHTTMNSTKHTIRIFGEEKPAMAVISKLMKLTKESVIYSIQKYQEQTDRIKNPTAYMLTILYNAPEQYRLDIENRVAYDMANGGLADG